MLHSLNKITLQGRLVMFKEYTQYDGLALAALVNSGEVSAKELLDAAVHQANQINPKLNAIVHRFDERAYNAAQAGLPSGVFTGVPYLLKDLVVCQKVC